jgi:hypothetical protein
VRERIKIHVVFVHGIGVLDQRKVFVQAVIIPSSLGIPDRQYLLRHFVSGHISRFRTCVLRLILQLARNPHTRQNHHIELLIHHSFFMHLHLLLIHILAANEIPPIALQSSAQSLAIRTRGPTQQRPQLGWRRFYLRRLGVELPVVEVR